MADEAQPLSPQTPPLAGDAGSFLESLMDTELYSIGAFFCDEHPDLVDEVVARSEAIERSGLEAYSRQSGGPIEESFETLLTGLAVRYYKAVAGIDVRIGAGYRARGCRACCWAPAPSACSRRSSRSRSAKGAPRRSRSAAASRPSS